MALISSAGDSATAFLRDGNTVYFTRVSPSPSLEAPWTPITALIEGIWNHSPEFANKILRNHICSFYPRTPLCDGMIKVAAKRARILSEIESYSAMEDLEDCNWVETGVRLVEQACKLDPWIGKTISIDEAVALAKELSFLSAQNENRFESDRTVGGVLLSDLGEVLSLGWNTNARQRVHHCELNLIRNYFVRNRQLIPKNATLIVTLKPCAMCAAQLFTFSEAISSLKILYLEDDPGPAATNSVLIQGSDLWKKAGAPAISMSRF